MVMEASRRTLGGFGDNNTREADLVVEVVERHQNILGRVLRMTCNKHLRRSRRAGATPHVVYPCTSRRRWRFLRLADVRIRLAREAKDKSAPRTLIKGHWRRTLRRKRHNGDASANNSTNDRLGARGIVCLSKRRTVARGR